jgi:hypothetical protein
LLAGIQGGVLVMLATGQLGYLEAALDVGIGNLRTARPAARSQPTMPAERSAVDAT